MTSTIHLQVTAAGVVMVVLQRNTNSNSKVNLKRALAPGAPLGTSSLPPRPYRCSLMRRAAVHGCVGASVSVELASWPQIPEAAGNLMTNLVEERRRRASRASSPPWLGVKVRITARCSRMLYLSSWQMSSPKERKSCTVKRPWKDKKFATFAGPKPFRLTQLLSMRPVLLPVATTKQPRVGWYAPR